MIFGDRITRRHILRDTASFEDVERFCSERGWNLVAGREEDQDAGQQFERIWLTATTLTFHYAVDYISSQSFVSFFGDDFGAVAGFEEGMVADLNPWSVDDLIAAVDSAASPVERGRCLLRAALGAPLKLEQRLFDRIAATIANDDSMQRQIGVLAAGNAAWPRLRPVLRTVTEQDTDEDVRGLAESTLDAFDRAGVKES